MEKCSKCKKDKSIDLFLNREKKYKQCLECRENSKKWREKNKEVTSLYNKNYNEKKQDNKELTFVYARKVKSNDDWIKFETQLNAARVLNLHASNINKVIKGELKTTGGYEFKLEKEIYKSENIKWESIKKENNIISKCKGQPSQHRILHEETDAIFGKKCCSCKEWRSLNEYNKDKKHWDKLRVDCKICLIKWRKENRNNISKKYVIYEKKRKLIDPEFKLLKILRSRLGSLFNDKRIKKNNTTVELTGCSISFLKGYLEGKFKDGMTWENHGEWHIDHIKPCASYNLLNEKEQIKCFHYTNLQPLWRYENLSKGSKYDELVYYENEYKFLMEYFYNML